MKKVLLIGITMAFGIYAEHLDDSCSTCTLKLAMADKAIPQNSQINNQVKNSVTQVRDKIREISLSDLYRKIKDPKQNFMLINVLGQRFYDDCHIKFPEEAQSASISVPLRVLEEKAQSWDKNQEIIVYCACIECDASYKAYKMLIKLGFKNVTAYEGGIREWWQTFYKKDPSVIEGPCSFPFLKDKKEKTNRLLSMRDGALKQLLLEVHWGLRG